MSTRHRASSVLTNLPMWLKVRVAKALCHPLVGRVIARASGGEVSRYGCDFVVPVEQVGPETVASLFWGFYESAEIRFVRTHLGRDLDVVELGASIGIVSSVIRRHIDPERRLICVEANPRLVTPLRANLKRNANRGHWAVVNAAVVVDEQTKTVPFIIGERSTSSWVGDSHASIPVPAVTLRTILAEHDVGDYAMVADIEGAEIGIIAHEQAALGRCRQLIIELHGSAERASGPSNSDLVGALTRDHGFLVKAAHGPVMVFERPCAPARSDGEGKRGGAERA